MFPSWASPAARLRSEDLEHFSQSPSNTDPLDIRAPLALSGPLVKRISSMILIRESWMNFIIIICVKYNTKKRGLGHTDVVSSDSEDGHNHVVSKASDIVSER